MNGIFFIKMCCYTTLICTKTSNLSRNQITQQINKYYKRKQKL